MKTFFYALFFTSFIRQSCTKSDTQKDDALHYAKVLAATCSNNNSQVAIQLEDEDPLAFDWKNPSDNVVYHNVVTTFSTALHSAIGKTITYSSVRQPTSSDPSQSTFAICLLYPTVIIENVTVK